MGLATGARGGCLPGGCLQARGGAAEPGHPPRAARAPRRDAAGTRAHPFRQHLALRGGAAEDTLGIFDPIGQLCALPELSDDRGINVTLDRRGSGWRRPASGDEVLVSYVGRELLGGRQFERCDERRLVRLGQGALPPGLERAIVLRFGKGAQGLVTLAPAHAFGEEGRAPLIAANATVEYNLTLWDWNDVWEAPEGRVAFRGLGQPLKHSPPAGDSDNLTLSLSGITSQYPAARATAAPGSPAVSAPGAAPVRTPVSSVSIWKDQVMGISTYALRPTPCTLHPAPYTLHPTPYILHPTPDTLHPTPYTLHPTPYTLHPRPYTLHSTPYTPHHSQNPKRLRLIH